MIKLIAICTVYFDPGKEIGAYTMIFETRIIPRARDMFVHLLLALHKWQNVLGLKVFVSTCAAVKQKLGR